MPAKGQTAGLLKISELAARAGVSLTTVKFYAKEGLIQPACKTGRNMAWYDPACVPAIRMIRALQKERFYPLSVIKRLLERGGADALELELLDAIQKVDFASDGAAVPLAEAVRRTGLSTGQIALLAAAGLVPPPEGRQPYSQEELAVLSLARRRLDAGIPLEQTVEAFTIYHRALKPAAEADVDSFLSRALMTRGATAEEAARMIRVSDDTLDAFVVLLRKRFNRAGGVGRIEELGRFEQALHRSWELVCAAVEEAGLTPDARLCRKIQAGIPTGLPGLDAAAGHYWALVREGRDDLAKGIACAARSRDFFLSPAGGQEGLAGECLRACWLSLAPPGVDCREAGREYTQALCHQLAARNQPGLASRLRQLLIPGQEARGDD